MLEEGLDFLGHTIFNRTTIGGSLILVGVAITFGANFRILNKVWFSAPLIGDVTIMRFMGAITTVLGITVLLDMGKNTIKQTNKKIMNQFKKLGNENPTL